MESIVVAGGCFWGVEEYFRRLNGTVSTKVGYAQGTKGEPTYQEVCQHKTGHAEVVMVNFEAPLTLEKVCEHLFRIIDPTSLNKQGNDRGEQYRTGFYYSTDEQKELIVKYIEERQKEYTKKIVVEVEPLEIFWDAETYHQKYLIKNPMGYCHVDFSKIKPEELK